jgi:hypothetical protein
MDVMAVAGIIQKQILARKQSFTFPFSKTKENDITLSQNVSLLIK